MLYCTTPFPVAHVAKLMSGPRAAWLGAQASSGGSSITQQQQHVFEGRYVIKGSKVRPTAGPPQVFRVRVNPNPKKTQPQGPGGRALRANGVEGGVACGARCVVPSSTATRVWCLRAQQLHFHRVFCLLSNGEPAILQGPPPARGHQRPRATWP